MFDILRDFKQKMTAKKNLKIYDSMLDVSDVASGYGFWQRVLVEKIIRMFEYGNLPNTIPATELEKLVLLLGKGGVLPTEYGFIAIKTHLYGVGIYKNYPPYAVWASPLVSGEGIVNKDIVVIRNNSFMSGVRETVDRYARMLADVESTLAITLINLRQPSMTAAPDENTAYSYQAARLAMTLGSPEAVLNTSVLDDIKNFDAIKTIPATLLTDIIDARDRLLSAFLSEFGVATKDSKKAPMTISEVQSDTQVMTVNITDMLETRKECVKILNYVYGLNVTVKLNEAYKPVEAPRPEMFNKTGNPLTGQAEESDNS